jgi:GAF domain-containing protein
MLSRTTARACARDEGAALSLRLVGCGVVLTGPGQESQVAQRSSRGKSHLSRDDLLTVALSDFARTLVRHFDISDVLYDLITRVSAVLEVTSAGVSLVEDGRLCFITALDERTTLLENVQEDLQAGSCIEAYRSGEPVVVASLESEGERWPTFVEEAMSLGIAWVAGIPMRLEDGSLGALDLYHSEPRDWSDDDVRIALILADMASSYVVTASELQRQQRTNEQLQRALDSRVVIEEAKGVLAADAVINLGLRP